MPGRVQLAVADLLGATAVVAVAVLVGIGLRGTLPVASLALVFVCGVLLVAVRSRKTVAVYAALLSALAYNFFFTEPRLTLRIANASEIAAVVTFLLAALVVGHLAGRQRAQLVELEVAHERTRALQTLGERLAQAADEERVLEAGCEAAVAALGGHAAALAGDGEGGLRLVTTRPPHLALEPPELAAAARALVGSAAAPPTGPGRGSAWTFLPLAVERERIGVLGCRLPPAGAAPADRLELAAAIARQVAQAAGRVRLVTRLEAARLEGESERLRTALLSSLSHDLRSPLSSVLGAATSLSAYGDTMPAIDRRDLLEAIRSEAERLDRYIQNLLDMTRLGAGPLRLERHWIDLEEIVAAAVERLGRLHPRRATELELGPGLPPLHVHPALIEQALFNVLENAADFSPPDEPIRVVAGRRGDRLTLDVVDRGPGIPESERRRVFERFYGTGRGDRGPRGSGLGLAIVRGMVGAHGGSVEALPGDGGIGTTIRIELPLEEPPAAATDPEEA